MATLVKIEESTKQYADSRNALAGEVKTLQDAIEALKRKHLPRIKKLIEAAATKQTALQALVEESPELFTKPRTVIFHGIKVGFEKGKGKMEWNDDDTVIRLIEKNFPDQADVLVKTTKKPVKKALAQLSVAELKKLGVTVEETDDHVVIKSTDSDIDKLVSALLKDDSEDLEDAA